MLANVTARELAERRLELLVRASAVLGETLDYEDGVRRVAELAVPDLADWCAIDVVEDDDLRRLALVHEDARDAELLKGIQGRFLRPTPMIGGVVEVIRTGESLLRTVVEHETLVAPCPEHLDLLRRIAPRSIMIVPLRVRGRTLGALVCSSTTPDRPYTTDDLSFLEELARLVAVAIDNARLLQQLQGALRARAESQALVDTLFSAAPIGMGFLDPNLRYVRANDALAAMIGVPAHRLIGRTPRDVLPHLADVVEPLYEQVLATATPLSGVEIQGETAAAPGELRWFLPSYYPVLDHDRVLGVGVVGIEITERKRTEEAFRLLADAGRRLAGSLERDVTVRTIAELAVPALGDWCVVYLPQAAGPCAALVHGAEERVGTWLEAHGNELVDGTTIRGGDPQILHGNQVPRPLRARGVASSMIVPFQLREGVGALWLGSHRRVHGSWDVDVATLLASRCVLALENVRLYEGARDAARARDQFLVLTSHELNTPLTPLKLKVDLLERLAREGDESQVLSERMVTTIEGAVEGVERVSRVAGYLYDVAQIITGGLALQLQTVDLGEVVSAVASRHGPDLQHAGCALDLDVHSVTGEWDRRRLEQVVEGLLSNAAKYGAGRPIEVSVREIDHRAVLSIRDHGLGMPAEGVERIFDRFERLVQTRQYSGFGLGLWVVREIVDALGGRVEVESAPGHGALFRVSLPRAGMTRAQTVNPV